MGLLSLDNLKKGLEPNARKTEALFVSAATFKKLNKQSINTVDFCVFPIDSIVILSSVWPFMAIVVFSLSFVVHHEA